jgi:hypothetical protein
MTRICKICGIQKEFNYLCLDGRQRTVYKDEQGKIWHNKRCYDCHLQRVRNDRKIKTLKT